MKSLDILVPTRNEERLLPAFLRSLLAAIAVVEESVGADKVDISVLIIDGKSNDRTRQIAEEFGVTVLIAEESGRGNQLAAGAASSRGDWVLLLHADSTMEPWGLLELVRAVRSSDRFRWGILGHRYAHGGVKMRWVQLSNYLRFHLLGIAFGDQGMFLHRDTLERAGGIPRFPLMEDVEISLRLRGRAKRKQLGGPLQVSTRRWEIKGSFGYTLQVFSLMLRYLGLRLVGSDLEKCTQRMHREYYGGAT